MCALSKFHVITARASDGPKGSKLDFETSGKLRGTSVVAATKGTTVVVENLFYNLPVRRKELEKNIKREYGKVLNLLHAYACISEGTRFAVSGQMPKGKKTVLFSTKANPTTKENIANVYGAKTLAALIALDLKLEMQPSSALGSKPSVLRSSVEDKSREIMVLGHISRPVFGEGRQTPDRQMFFVNSRPCALPQVAKAFNEVYKSYNISQSPFVFADFKMDTRSYDINVSPDKRTILLHDQAALLETLKNSLIELFESHDQSVPQSQFLQNRKLPTYRSFALDPNSNPPKGNTGILSDKEEDAEEEAEISELKIIDSPSRANSSPPTFKPATSLLEKFTTRDTVAREKDSVLPKQVLAPAPEASKPPAKKQKIGPFVQESDSEEVSLFVKERSPVERGATWTVTNNTKKFNARVDRQRASKSADQNVDPLSSSDVEEELRIPDISPSSNKYTPGTIQNAFDRMRPRRSKHEMATITVGNVTTEMPIGTPPKRARAAAAPALREKSAPKSSFGKRLDAFAAPGSWTNSGMPEDSQASEEIETSGSEDEKIVSANEDSGSDNDGGEEVDRIDQMVAEGIVTAEDKSDEDEVLNLRQLPSDEVVGPEDDASGARASDDEYIDEDEKKAREEARVARLIVEAEEAGARPTRDNKKRANHVLKHGSKKYSTLSLIQNAATSTSTLDEDSALVQKLASDVWPSERTRRGNTSYNEEPEAAEERLQLTVVKSDFARMRIVGQFNLGFILAVRPAADSVMAPPSSALVGADELFIIDQHASDEKFNFERLQRTTVLDPQRLVHPHSLSLTAVEEEVVACHRAALAANGFLVDFDDSGDRPVGARCRLLTLPTSREVTFAPRDFEELLVLLADTPHPTPSTPASAPPSAAAKSDTSAASGAHIPRPSKVRRLLAMRACRSSVMVGRTLTHAQMRRLVWHMGEIDKPWNCPHGRPTMRHLFGLAGWSGGWSEGEGVLADWEAQHHHGGDWGAEEEEQGNLEGIEEDEEDEAENWDDGGGGASAGAGHCHGAGAGSDDGSDVDAGARHDDVGGGDGGGGVVVSAGGDVAVGSTDWRAYLRRRGHDRMRTTPG